MPSSSEEVAHDGLCILIASPTGKAARTLADAYEAASPFHSVALHLIAPPT